jgi:16S rRNA (cytosine967-C5)-methyltransferase
MDERRPPRSGRGTAGGRPPGGKKGPADRTTAPKAPEARKPRPGERPRNLARKADFDEARANRTRRDDGRADERPKPAADVPEREPRQRAGRKVREQAERDAAARRPQAGAASRRFAHALDVLDAMSYGRATADKAKNDWFRGRPHVDGQERAQIERMVDDVMRYRAGLDWWIDRAGRGLPPTDQARLVAMQILVRKRKPKDALAQVRRPDPELSKLAEALGDHTIDHPDMPAATRAGIPAWLEPALAERFGRDLEAEMQAMLRPAPLDLRVNALAAGRDLARERLAQERLEAVPTPYSPLGLRLKPGTDIGPAKALADGLVEPQDEGSQLASLLADARPGQFVVDLCAGAGGKTLAMAGQMVNRGRLVALDISEGRLARARTRLRRAGVHNAECRELDRKWIKRHGGEADRVLVDAPCTGTGVWRRKPDARWRLAPTDLPELTAAQSRLLDDAARLVAPGGRVVYVTCSLLRAENEDQVAAFLARQPDFTLRPIAEVWGETVGGAPPAKGDMLLLTPARHGCDGFFVAVLERKG